MYSKYQTYPTKKRVRSGDTSIKRSFNSVKKHFSQRFEAFDKIVSEHERVIEKQGEGKENPVKIKPAFYDLIQEGIGTLIMHLPRELAVQTLGDFQAILSTNLKRTKSKKDGEENSAEAEKVLVELDNVKNHVIEHNHIEEVFVEPLLVAIAEMNGDKTPPDVPRPSQEEKYEHEELDKQSRMGSPKAQPVETTLDEFTIIEGATSLELSEMNGQVDYLAPLGESHFLVGSTQGYVCIYNNQTYTLSKQLDTGGLSIYEMAYTAKGKRLAVGCDEGLINIYDLDAHDRVGQVKAYYSDVTSLLYVTHDRLVVGQVEGYIDVIKFTGTKAIITHSLQINEAGDINHLSLASKPLELMIACQKGLLLCNITKNETLQIIRPEEEYSNLYVVTMAWCGGDKYIVVTSRPKYKKEKHIPKGEENFAIVTFTLFQCECTDPDMKYILLGQFRTTFEQACFPVSKVQVIVPKNANPADSQNPDSEVPYKGRFYLTMVDTYLKVIDIQQHCLFDLLSEPNFDQDSVSGMGLVRSLADKSYRLLILCQNEQGNYVQKIDFAATLPKSLAQRVQYPAAEGQKNEIDDAFFVE